MKGGKYLFFAVILSLMTSCLSLSADLEIRPDRTYLLNLEYSLRSDFARIKYLANNRSVMTLPLTQQEYIDFASTRGGVGFLPGEFSRVEQGERIIINARLTFDNIEILEDLLSCQVLLEGENPYGLTLSYQRSGEPSNEAVTYINGYCAGENISMTIQGPNGARQTQEWSLRELLLEPQAPSMRFEWEE